MGPKCKQKELRFFLNDALGPVTWVRVTCTRDTRNKRENYTINLYTGSSDDDHPTPTFLSGTAQLHVSISDRQLQESGLDVMTYVRYRITETIERRILGKSTIQICHSLFIHSFIHSVMFS